MQIEIDKSIGRKGGVFGLTPGFAKAAFLILIVLFILYMILSSILSPLGCLLTVVLLGATTLITLKFVSHKYGDDGLGKLSARRQLYLGIKATGTTKRLLSHLR